VDQLSYDLRLTPEQISFLHYADFDAEDDLKRCAELGIEVLRPLKPDFPRRKLDVLEHSLPVMLFCRGNLELFRLPAMGVSGSRKAADQSLERISGLCERVASEGWVIVSGGARGVDETAHLAAIRSGVGTIIVLPTGILKAKIRSEFKRHLEEGKVLIVSEFPPEQGWTTGCAMQRNRLIAALSMGVVLVDPGIKSGTRGTGKIALKMGVPCYILRDGLGKPEGAESLIEMGARFLDPKETPAEILVKSLKKEWETSQSLREKQRMERLL
jgi:DNA processing protein